MRLCACAYARGHALCQSDTGIHAAGQVVAEADHGGPGLGQLLEGKEIVVEDQHGVLRLVSTALLRDFARDLASKTRNPAFVSA